MTQIVEGGGVDPSGVRLRQGVALYSRFVVRHAHGRRVATELGRGTTATCSQVACSLAVLRQRCWLVRKMGDLEQAFRHYHEALRLNPEHRGGVLPDITRWGAARRARASSYRPPRCAAPRG
jgi:hypothetical protein